MKASEKYARLVTHFGRGAGVTSIAEGKGFGSSGQLKVDGRIFAMLVRDELVLKLPAARVTDLVSAREGTHFDAGKGKPMREWFVLSPTSNKEWRSLAGEAMAFVRNQR